MHAAPITEDVDRHLTSHALLDGAARVSRHHGRDIVEGIAARVAAAREDELVIVLGHANHLWMDPAWMRHGALDARLSGGVGVGAHPHALVGSR